MVAGSATCRHTVVPGADGSRPTRPGHGALPTGRGRRTLVRMLLWLLSASLLSSRSLQSAAGYPSGGPRAPTWSPSSSLAAAVCTSAGLRVRVVAAAAASVPARMRRPRRLGRAAAGQRRARTAPSRGPRAAGGLGRARPAPLLGEPVGLGGQDARGDASARSPSVLKTGSTPLSEGMLAAST